MYRLSSSAVSRLVCWSQGWVFESRFLTPYSTRAPEPAWGNQSEMTGDRSSDLRPVLPVPPDATRAVGAAGASGLRICRAAVSRHMSGVVPEHIKKHRNCVRKRVYYKS